MRNSHLDFLEKGGKEMTLGDLLEIVKYSPIHLHSGYNGKLIAYTRNSLKKFVSVRILSAYPKIKCARDEDYAAPYLYV